MTKKLLLALAFASSPGILHAENFHPNALPPRLYGLSQWASPSCQSEAEAQAIEQVFANRGQKVLISPLHRHWKNWKGKDNIKPRLPVYTPGETALIESTASFVPDYMWPAGDFREGWSSGSRPRLADIADIDPSFPKDAELGYSETYLSFRTQDNGALWGNTTRDLGQLIQAAKNREALILEVHGEFFHRYLNHATGLVFPGKYSHADFYNALTFRNESSKQGDWQMEEYLKAARRGKEGLWKNESSDDVPYEVEQNHAVVVVGFSSDLYAGEFANPGAFIVRNSWNDESAVSISVSKAADADLERFRYPLYRSMSPGTKVMNLPGYYAIPVAYVEDMMNYTRADGSGRKGVGGFYRYSLDWNRFVTAYDSLASRYKVKKVPFVCDGSKVNAVNLITRFNAFMDSEDSDLAKTALEMAFDEALIGRGRTFRIATLAEKDGASRGLNLFTSGALNQYYCANSSDEGAAFQSVWPGGSAIAIPEVSAAVDQISLMTESPFSWVSYLKAMNLYKQ